jgi:hypothetical protein
MTERKDRSEYGEVFGEYLGIAERVAREIGVENLAGLIGEYERVTLDIPTHHKYGQTYPDSRFLVSKLKDYDCTMIACGTPEGESISGLGGIYPNRGGGTELRLPRFITGPAARDDLEFLGYQMSYALVEQMGMPSPEDSMIIDFYREGPWSEIQRHLWYISKGTVEIPTDKVTICHTEADNFLNRTAEILNGHKMFYQVEPREIKTLFLNDSSASGAQMAEVIDYLTNQQGCRPERVVLMSPMITLYSVVCLAELLKDRNIELVTCTGASLLDINYGNEPEPGDLYYSPYPASPLQLANPEFLELYKKFHPNTVVREGIRCNWTESFLLTIRAMFDSGLELEARNLTNDFLRQAMAGITIQAIANIGMDYKKLIPYSSRLEGQWRMEEENV